MEKFGGINFCGRSSDSRQTVFEFEFPRTKLMSAFEACRREKQVNCSLKLKVQVMRLVAEGVIGSKGRDWKNVISNALCFKHVSGNGSLDSIYNKIIFFVNILYLEKVKIITVNLKGLF